VSSRFSAEQAFSAAVSFDISASTSFPFGSPHGIRTAVANYSVPMIRVFSPVRPETIVRWHRAGFRAYNETRTHLEASSAGKSG
jgi:hypothetical protein